MKKEFSKIKIKKLMYFYIENVRKNLNKKIKVIVPTVVVQFFQSATIQEILVKFIYFYNLCNIFYSWSFKNEVNDRFVYAPLCRIPL